MATIAIVSSVAVCAALVAVYAFAHWGIAVQMKRQNDLMREHIDIERKIHEQNSLAASALERAEPYLRNLYSIAERKNGCSSAETIKLKTTLNAVEDALIKIRGR